MGFRISAHGVTEKSKKDFTYIKSNCLDQSDFEPPQVFSLIPSSPNLEGVAMTAADFASSQAGAQTKVGGATVAGAFKVAEMQLANMVVLEMNTLAMRSPMGSVSLYCYKKGGFIDTNSFVSYQLKGGNPGHSFLQSIIPVLEKSGHCNFGVLSEIANVLRGYRKAGMKGNFMLRIEVRG